MAPDIRRERVLLAAALARSPAWGGGSKERVWRMAAQAWTQCCPLAGEFSLCVVHAIGEAVPGARISMVVERMLSKVSTGPAAPPAASA